MTIKFKKDFFFGACTSATQSEGNHWGFRTNWDMFRKKSPKSFHNGCGPQKVSNTYNDFKKEIALYKEMGLETFKTSVQWSRIFPMKGVVSQAGIDFYHEYFQELRNNGIRLFISMSHFDLPDWVYKNKGFENYENCDYFLGFAKVFLNEFGQYAELVSTFNEPIVPIQFGYLDNLHPPAIFDKKRAIKAAFGVILAHSKVANYFYNEFRNTNNLKLGVNVNIAPIIPKDGINFDKKDKEAADTFNLVHNYSFLDAMVMGQFDPMLVSFLKANDCFFQPEQEHLALIAKNKLDFIGINYYQPFRIQAWKNQSEIEDVDHILKNIGKEYHWKEARMNKSRGWEIYPEIFGDICKIVKERYNNMPFYISENGMGVENEERFRKSDGMIHDDYRIAFIKEHLQFLNKAIKEYNSNCLGFHMWAALDCWSWCNAYKNRYGFVEYDLLKKEKRLKKSAFWYKQLTLTKSFDDEGQRVEDLIDCSN